MSGPVQVAAELRRATPLMTALRAPIPARAPWLTAVLNARAAEPTARRWRSAAAAVVVDGTGSRPAAAAFLALRRQGPVTVVSMLGAAAAPLPGGRPTARLLAADPDAARLLADGILDLLSRRRGPWALRLTGLPLGDPTAAELAAALPDSVLANVRSRQLVDELDELDGVGAVERSRDPVALERWLPALLRAEPDSRAQTFLRAAARLHAAIGRVEVAVVADGDGLQAGLLTLLDGADRWPWWGTSRIGGLGDAPGSPLVGLTVAARRWRPWLRAPAAGH
ncbi:MAG: hypothetical protein QOJ68_2994 [Blastococcus sp.]|nr:hypothetical protein [Blastococcus sp.]